MKSIIIGFSKSKKKFAIGSMLIRLYQNSKFSHVYARITTKFLGSDTIVHASEGKILRMSDPQFNKRHEVVEEFKITMTDVEYMSVMKELHKASGDDYGIMQNIGIVLVDILAILGKKIKNPFNKGWNCSEFVCILLQQSNIELVKDLDPQTVTPKQLYKLLKTLK